jgi:hypothetical protein
MFITIDRYIIVLLIIFVVCLVILYTIPSKSEVFESSISPSTLLNWKKISSKNIMLEGHSASTILVVNPNPSGDVNIALLIVRHNDDRLLGYSYVEDGKLVSYIYDAYLGYVENNNLVDTNQQELKLYLDNLNIKLFKRGSN